MRQKLNENPVAQIVLIGVLFLVGGYFVLTQLGGGEEESAPESAPTASVAESASPEGTEESAPSSGGGRAGSPVEVAGGGHEIAAASASATAPVDRPMPMRVQRAYASDKTIALLIVRDGGIDDHLLRDATDVLEGRPHVAFFSTRAQHIARFAQITGPLGVNQVPALIVIRPQRLNGKGPAPASVTYGFQTKAGVRQTIQDAVYRGDKLSYSPH